MGCYRRVKHSISLVKVEVTPFTNNVTGINSLECFAIPALRLCFISMHIVGVKSAHIAGQKWTAANVTDEEYFPSQNIDLCGSADGNILITPYLWTDGQIVVTSQINTVPANINISMSGFWFY